MADFPRVTIKTRLYQTISFAARDDQVYSLVSSVVGPSESAAVPGKEVMDLQLRIEPVEGSRNPYTLGHTFILCYGSPEEIGQACSMLGEMLHTLLCCGGILNLFDTLNFRDSTAVHVPEPEKEA